MKRRNPLGQASLVVIVISMLIAFALIATYLRTSISTGDKGGPAGTLEAVKQKANAFEEQQRRHMEELQHEVAQ